MWSRRKKDFEITWFNGQGGGGQHRNKNATCCRMKDKETGFMTESQEFKSAIQNRKSAFRKMVKKLLLHYKLLEAEEKARKQTASFGQIRIRTYNKCNDRVVDEQTGDQYSYRHTVGKGDISQIIEERRRKLLTDGYLKD